MGIKGKAISVVTVLMLLMAVLFLCQGAGHYDKEIERTVAEETAQIDTVLGSIRELSLGRYRARIKGFLRANPLIVEAFVAHDRQTLLRLVQPKFKVLHRENPHFAYFEFALPDGTPFLRLAGSSLYGEETGPERPIVRAATAAGRQLAGFEMGESGAFYRVAEPIGVDDNTTPAGTLEFAIRATEIVEALRERLAAQFSLYFEVEAWKNVTQGEHGIVRRGDYVLATHGNELFRSLPVDFRLDGTAERVVIGDRTFVVQHYPILTDYQGRPFGGVAVLLDITSVLRNKRVFIAQTIGWTVLFLLLSLGVLYLSFTHLLGRLEAYHRRQQELLTSLTDEVAERVRAEESLKEGRDRLEERVRERTAELAQANEALREEIEERRQITESLREALARSERLTAELEQRNAEVVSKSKELANAYAELKATQAKIRQ